MGKIISAMQEEAEEEVKAKLDMMQKLLQNKIDAITYQLKEKANMDEQLPIVAIVDSAQEMRVSVTQSASQQVSKTVDDIFSGDFLGGLKDMVTAGLNVLLGDASAGVKENTGFSVVYSDNSLLRVDYYMYKYNLSSSGIKDDVTNGFLYFTQICVLDLEKVSPEVVLFELSKSVGKENFQKVTEDLQAVTKFAKQLFTAIKDLKEDDAENEPEEDPSA